MKSRLRKEFPRFLLKSKCDSHQFVQKQNSAQGQIIVEYVLLLAIAVTIAGLLISGLVSRNPDSPGAIVAAWHSMLNAIAADDAGGVAPFP